MTTEFDPTTNRVPWGLLTDEEQEALQSWPHGVLYFCNTTECWHEKYDERLWDDLVYRGKPAPVVTSKWLSVYPDGLTSLHEHKPEYYLAGYKPIAVLRIDTCNGVSTAHLEEV
jgi:hypothetical protein